VCWRRDMVRRTGGWGPEWFYMVVGDYED